MNATLRTVGFALREAESWWRVWSRGMTHSIQPERGGSDGALEPSG